MSPHWAVGMRSMHGSSNSRMCGPEQSSEASNLGQDEERSVWQHPEQEESERDHRDRNTAWSERLRELPRGHEWRNGSPECDAWQGVCVLEGIKKTTLNKRSQAPNRESSVTSVWTHQAAGVCPAKINGYTFPKKRQSPASNRKPRTLLPVSNERPKQDSKQTKKINEGWNAEGTSHAERALHL